MASYELKRPNFLSPDQDLSRVENRQTVPLKCPHCGHNGTFNNKLACTLQYIKWTTGAGTRAVRGDCGVYCCPNTSCQGLVLVVHDGAGVVLSLPSQQIDFDPDSIPSKLLETLKEAIACHSTSAFRASALMIRRLMEEICDEFHAKGSNLHQRLTDLRSKVPLSEALLDGAMELKILGNDAAHIEAKEYAAIGKEEAEIAVEVAKEILKALYQHKSLIERMQKLKQS